MKKWALVLILATGCGAEKPTPPTASPVPVPAAPSKPTASPGMLPPAPPADPPAPLPPPIRPYVPAPPTLPRSPDGQIHLAAFKLRSVSSRKADVFINGEAYSTLPTLWAVTSGMEFDPKIRVDDWPPQGARYAGKTTNLDDAGAGSAEVYVDSGKALEARYPHLQKGEHVVYVQALFRTGLRQGAIRLWAGQEAPLRYTGYAPFAAAESDEESRLLRTLWFDDPVDD